MKRGRWLPRLGLHPLRAPLTSPPRSVSVFLSLSPAGPPGVISRTYVPTTYIRPIAAVWCSASVVPRPSLLGAELILGRDVPMMHGMTFEF